MFVFVFLYQCVVRRSMKYRLPVRTCVCGCIEYIGFIVFVCCICLCIRVFVCACIFVYIFTCTSIWMWFYTFVCVCIFRCMYIYVHLGLNVFVHVSTQGPWWPLEGRHAVAEADQQVTGSLAVLPCEATLSLASFITGYNTLCPESSL